MKVEKLPAASLQAQMFWLVVARVLGFVFSLVLPLLLVRLLNPTVYGQYRQVFVLITTAGNLLPFNIPLSAFYFFPREPNKHREIVFNIILHHLAVAVLAAVAFWGLPGLIEGLLGQPELVPYAPAIGLALALYVFSSFLETVATAHEDIRASTVFIVSANLSKSILLAGAAVLSPTLDSILAAAIAQGTIQSAVLLWYLAVRFPKFWTRFDGRFLRDQLIYTFPLGVSAMLIICQRELHFYYVSHFFSSAEYAVYAVGTFQLPLLGIIYYSLTGVLLGHISALQKDGQTDKIIAVAAKCMRKLSVAFMPMMFFLLVCAEEFIVALFTRDYIESVPIFRLNLLLIATMIPITDPIFRAFSEHRMYLVKVRAVLVVCLTAMLYFFVDRSGMTGAVFAVLIVTIVERILASAKAVRILNISPADARLFTPNLEIAAAAAVPALVVLAVRGWTENMGAWTVLVLNALVYMAGYAALILRFGLLDQDEKALLGKVADRLALLRLRMSEPRA